MPEDTLRICVYYFSLPEFPKNCKIVKNNSLYVRDILVCNPSNPHVKYCGQYDPHYEHCTAPQFKVCWEKTRRKIMSVINDNLYDRIYLLFRTTKVLLSKQSSQCISGYYDIDLDKVEIDPEYNEPVLYAKRARFVDSQSAIDLSVFSSRLPGPRFPWSNKTREGAFEKYLASWTRKIERSPNKLDDYITMTKQLDKVFKYHEFEEGVYQTCEDCSGVDKCYLIKRIRKKGKVYHQLPQNIAIRINNYYKKTIRMS